MWEVFRQMGVPDSFTSKVAASVAYPAAVSITSSKLWLLSLQYPGGFTMECPADYRTLEMVEGTVGEAGDHIMPFGEAANMLLSVINSMINAAAAHP
jgi:hypothetical protein